MALIYKKQDGIPDDMTDRANVQRVSDDFELEKWLHERLWTLQTKKSLKHKGELPSH